MTLEELNTLASSQAYIYLTLPRRTLPRGDQVRLAGRFGPLGKICTAKETENGYDIVAVFESEKILDYLNR